MIDGFPLTMLIKGPDLVGLQLFRLRIRNSSSDVGSSALIRKNISQSYLKSKLITRNTVVMKQYFTLEVPKDSAFPFIVRHMLLKKHQ